MEVYIMPRFDAPINTNDQSIDRVLANPLPVVLTLSGDKPAPALQKILDEIAKDEAGKLLVARVDTTTNPATDKRFNVGPDTVLIGWKNGTEQTRLANPMTDQVRAAANYLLGKGPAPRVTKAEPSATGTGNATAQPITVNEGNFEQQVLRSKEPVLVDFWAPWCGPCRMIAPTLEKLSQEYAGKIKIAKLNVDENQRLAQTYQAHSIPLMVMFKGGKAINKIIGAHPEPNIRNFIEQGIRA
jgi:thioredoxin 1